MKNLILIAVMIFSGQVFAQTSLSGKVIEGDSGAGAVLANVAIYKGTDLVTGVQTDFDGFYNFSNLDAGTYDVEVSYVGFQTVRMTDMIVYGSKANKLDVELGAPGLHLNEKKIIKAPVQKLSPRSGSDCLNSEQIKKLPIRKYGPIIPGIYPGYEEDRIYMGRGRSRSRFYMPQQFICTVKGISLLKEDSLLGGTPACKY